MNIKWSTAKLLLQEGDILLFRAKQNIFSLSYWIARYGFSRYSHVSLASIDSNTVYCIEFKEFVGSRVHPLIEEIQRGAKIDVYRISRHIHTFKVNPETGIIESSTKEFTPQIARQITTYGREKVGQSYAWSLIWRMIRMFIPILRLFINKDSQDEIHSKIYVCSTLVVSAYREHFVDLCPGIDDYMTQPGDIARSGLLSYLMTIIPD